MSPFFSGVYMFWDKYAYTWKTAEDGIPIAEDEIVEKHFAKVGREYFQALATMNPRRKALVEDAIISSLEEHGLLSKDELKQSQDPNFTGGRKFDGGKLQYGLVPPLALRETVKVLTFGAEKYEPDNWKRVPDPNRRYFDAAQRHLWAYKEGEVNDPESGVSHLAHALCCIMFMLDLDEEKK